MNGEKIEMIPGAEMVREKMQTSNLGIPEISSVKVGARCTLALPVFFPHQADKDGRCSFCKAEVSKAKTNESCPSRPPIVGHFNKVFKLAHIRDGGDTVILKRVK